MTTVGPWRFLREIEYGPHLTVWVAILRLESQGCGHINSGSVQDEVEELTGERRRPQSIHTSMQQLLEAGVVDRESDADVPNGYHWTTTPTGREIADTLAEEWGRARESGDTSNSATGED